MGYSRRDRLAYWLERHIRPLTLAGCALYAAMGPNPMNHRPMFRNRINNHVVLL